VKYLDVEEARALPGLRLVLSAGVPGPWGEAAKAILHVKQLGYTPVRQLPAQPNPALEAWTGRNDAPIAVWGDERPRAGWAEILLLAERLAPEPRLVPEDPERRALLFGYAHEICGEQGLGWSRRLMLVHERLDADAPPAARSIGEALGRKYGYSPEAAQQAPRRCAGVLRLLSDLLRRSREGGGRYLLGVRLTALDLYWAAFAVLLEPMPADACPLPGALRAMYTTSDPEIRAALDPALLAHRDFVYREHLPLPMEF
jgi:glutathione S-transferase